MERIQDILGAFLSAQGQHEAAAEAFESTERTQWERLAELVIRTAPEYNRTHAAQAVKLALDNPLNGGPNLAADFVLRPVPHPVQAGVTVYRAFKLEPDGRETDIGLLHEDVENLKRRVVGAYVARAIAVAKK